MSAKKTAPVYPRRDIPRGIQLTKGQRATLIAVAAGRHAVDALTATVGVRVVERRLEALRRKRCVTWAPSTLATLRPLVVPEIF